MVPKTEPAVAPRRFADAVRAGQAALASVDHARRTHQLATFMDADTGTPTTGVDAVQRITTATRKTVNRYMEVRGDDRENTDVEGLEREQRVLVKLDKSSYDKLDDDVRTSAEEGYTVLQLEPKEKMSDWVINTKVLAWDKSVSTKIKLKAIRGFRLPISCIESTEHILHHSKHSDAIPNYVPGTEPDDPAKHVNLSFKTRGRKATNTVAANVSDEDLADVALGGYQDYDFASVPLELNDGLLAIDPNKGLETMHAVAVVAVSKATGQFVVVERNAGTTTGNNMSADQSWLLNIYDSPAHFKSTLSDEHIVGKLEAE
jgi:hypothetical protein